jgi:outer membrane protein TolC
MLDALIVQALRDNPGLIATEERLKQAEPNLGTARAAAGGTASRA